MKPPENPPNNRCQPFEVSLITPTGVLLKRNYRLNLNIKHRSLTGGRVGGYSKLLHNFIVKEEDVIDCIYQQRERKATKQRDVRGIGIPVQSRLGIRISRVIHLLLIHLFIFKSLFKAQINICSPPNPTLQIVF